MFTVTEDSPQVSYTEVVNERWCAQVDIRSPKLARKIWINNIYFYFVYPKLKLPNMSGNAYLGDI